MSVCYDYIYCLTTVLYCLEVNAAREKNGVYIPKDRFLQDEAEKKAMSEKIERMENDFESRDKVESREDFL